MYIFFFIFSFIFNNLTLFLDSCLFLTINEINKINNKMEN